jgi:hypothetical protein
MVADWFHAAPIASRGRRSAENEQEGGHAPDNRLVTTAALDHMGEQAMETQ